MTSRERVIRAVHFQKPDRVPEWLPDREPDIERIGFLGPGDIEPEHEVNGRKRRVDQWGVVWETMGGGSFGEAVEYPIKDITEQEKYIIPDLHKPEFFGNVKQRVADIHNSDNPRYCLGVLPYKSLFEQVHLIYGLQNTFYAIAEDPDDLKGLIGRLAEKQRESIKYMAEFGFDGYYTYDDWGLQDRLMVNPNVLKEFWLPFYRDNWQYARELGLDVWMHSCGYIIDALPLFVDAGLNVIQQDQQENMGLENLDKAVGGKLAFWCPVDIQKTMVEGSVEDIRQYVKRMRNTIGNHDGGLIAMHYASPKAVGHTPEKIAAMCQAFREFGAYD